MTLTLKIGTQTVYIACDTLPEKDVLAEGLLMIFTTPIQTCKEALIVL